MNRCDHTYLFARSKDECKTGNSRIAFRSFCWLVGVLLLTGCLSPAAQSQRHTVTEQRPNPVVAMPGKIPLPHRLPVTPTPTPYPTLAAPISPFPVLLEDQITALQAKDRFFYGGNPRLPEVALTFDDGPNPPYTQEVLAILKQYNIHATFFDVGTQVSAYPDLVRQEMAAGHDIGDHTWSHPLLTNMTPEEITTELQSTSDLLEKTTGVRPVYFRPPYGSINAKVLTQVNKLGLTTFIWSDGSLDWTAIGPEAIANQVLSTVGNGAVILMHDGGGDRSRSIAALPLVINGLIARHYRFVTLTQLVADAHKQPEAAGSSKP